MNTAHYPDGRVERTVINGETEERLRANILKDLQSKMESGATRVESQRIDNKYALCPCGSRETFADCCGKTADAK